MRTRAMRKITRRYIWDHMKVSLWFVPLIMAIGAIISSWFFSWLDEQIPNTALEHSKFILTASPGEMQAIMIGVAGTVLATAGVVFSLLTLPLSTVASQFGSRLLRVFMRDRTTQIVLGMFVATFCYCLTTALSIPPLEVEALAPQITVTFGLLLMLLTFASLILLIQHISIMLQAPNIVAAAGSDLRDVVSARDVGATLEKHDLIGSSESELDLLSESEAYKLSVDGTGYIQFIDPEIILSLAKERDLTLRLQRKPGQFVISGEVTALVWPKEKVDSRLVKHLKRGIQVGNQRTPTQDVVYGINQLTEIAVRAMSPAINDPFTALTCLDHLADGLLRFVKAGESNPNYYDQDGKLRLVFEPATLTEMLAAAFDMLRHASCDNATVLLHMLDVIEIIGKETDSSQTCQELIRHAQMIQAESHAGALVEKDQASVQQRFEVVEALLKGTCDGN